MEPVDQTPKPATPTKVVPKPAIVQTVKPQPPVSTAAPTSTAKPPVTTAAPKPTAGKASEVTAKKRKLSETVSAPSEASATTTTPAPSPAATNGMDMEDYSIIPQTVRDLVSLLQTYGPLTAGQLEYNLPVSNSPSLIRDVLEVLLRIGLVRRVQETTNNPPRYCMGRGVPRADVINLQSLQNEIFLAHRQAKNSFERSKLLIEALKDETSNPKDLLIRLAKDYPEILQDPVYITALRNCQVDLNASDRPKRRSNVKARKPAVTKSSEAGALKETTHAPAPSPPANNSGKAPDSALAPATPAPVPSTTSAKSVSATAPKPAA